MPDVALFLKVVILTPALKTAVSATTDHGVPHEVMAGQTSFCMNP